MRAYLRYLRYLLRHKWYVFLECCKLGIPFRGILHDLSKFYPSEFKPYANYFYGDLKIPKVSSAFHKAWLYHQKRNKHHWQYWVLHPDRGEPFCIDMPLTYLKEMLADWRGASRAIKGYDDTPSWYQNNKDHIMLSDRSRKWIETNIGR